jgi:isocitrate lyase
MTPDARIQAEADQLEARWRDDPRWSSVTRSYGAADVVRLRGSVVPEQTLARNGAERLWELLQREEPVRALGALTGGQAVQMVKAGLEAIYLSGWQVAADGNLAGSTYPDQSLYPANSAPQLVKRLNNALQRADQIDWSEGRNGTHWFAPILADAEAGCPADRVCGRELLWPMALAGARAGARTPGGVPRPRPSRAVGARRSWRAWRVSRPATWSSR